MVFGNGVKNIQAAAYNGERRVINFLKKISLKTKKWGKKYTSTRTVHKMR